MDGNGCSWMFMDVDGCSWMFMDAHGCSWIFMDVHGCSWMFMDVNVDSIMSNPSTIVPEHSCLPLSLLIYNHITIPVQVNPARLAHMTF